MNTSEGSSNFLSFTVSQHRFSDLRTTFHMFARPITAGIGAQASSPKKHSEKKL
jgi:hypothetical protein